MAIVLSHCECDDGGLTGTTSRLSTNVRNLDFGRVYLGAEKELTFTLEVIGDLPIGYEAAFSGDALGYRAGPATGRVPSNGRLELSVVFAPASAGERAAELLVRGQDSAIDEVVVTLFAVGVRPPDCEDGNSCTVDTFDLATGQCRHDAARIACDDLNRCTTRDTCVDGICLGEGLSCDDGNACTDDLCDPTAGCAHILARSCDDGNPCTVDLCEADDGCTHENAENGTPCDDFEPCSFGDICLFGTCRGFKIPENTPCDDGDPCSTEERCIRGRCTDPAYRAPALGELKFATSVGPLAPGAEENPIIGRDNTVFVGTEEGITAVDECGQIAWTTTLPSIPSWSGAVAIPGRLSVPIGGRVVDVDAIDGQILGETDLSVLFDAHTASTATASVEVVDLAVRASGALVASMVRRVDNAGTTTIDGLLAEIDRHHETPSRFFPLGHRFARRIAIDLDESLVVILREDLDTKGSAPERVVRIGIGGLDANSWSTTSTLADHTDLAIGPEGEVYWSAGLLTITRTGTQNVFLRGSPAGGVEGRSPVVGPDRVLIVHEEPESQKPALELMASRIAGPSKLPYALQAFDRLGAWLWTYPLEEASAPTSPAIDVLGSTVVAEGTVALHLVSQEGRRLFRTPLPFSGTRPDPVAVGITPDGVAIVVAEGRVAGVRVSAGLAASGWPRHRHDNLATSHR